MRILFVGDVVGPAGRDAFAAAVKDLRLAGEIDFVVANAENSAGGKGLTLALAAELFAAGADVLTTGDHVWDRKELLKTIDSEPRILRPANLPSGCPGRGWLSLDSRWGRVTVVNLVGRVFMNAVDCPFRVMDELLASGADTGRVILVDIHAEATSEKIAMGWYLDGRVSALVGTHTHVQTADERVLPGGTGYITDLGMTGVKNSVIGRDTESVLGMFVNGVPSSFKLARGVESAVCEGALVDVDEFSGRARTIRRIRFPGAEAV
jgi:metallophosphoesterase (TIGR00282 family)